MKGERPGSDQHPASARQRTAGGGPAGGGRQRRGEWANRLVVGALGLNPTLLSYAKGVIDGCMIMMAAYLAWQVTVSQTPGLVSPRPYILTVLATRLALNFALPVRRMSWRHVSQYEILWLAVSAGLGVPIVAFISFVVLPYWHLDGPYILARPQFLLLTEAAFYLLLLSVVRVAVMMLDNPRRNGDRTQRLLVVGAGSAARALASHMDETPDGYEIVAFVDDDVTKHGKWVRGRPVAGAIKDAARVARKHQAHQIVIAIPTLPVERLREVLAYCEDAGLPVRIMPALRDLMAGNAQVTSLREVSMEDLLPRPEVKLDRVSISRYLTGKTVLVTGGGGSIGRELCRQVMRAGAERILVLGRGENSIFEALQELSEESAQSRDCELIAVICDVQDRRALAGVFERYAPQVAFHAAAHKHVTFMEQYPLEAVKNNIVGTLNLVQLADEYEVERLVLVSTDKAVNPMSVMGATKRVAEMIVRGYAEASNGRMVSVRFGNVLGSRGSVVPIMQRQIQRRLPVTVTDPDMVRYFMTIPEAVQLILQAGATAEGGEVFVLNMGHPVRIMDLATDLIRLHGLVPNVDIPIVITGRRPGEKLREELLTPTEAKGVEVSDHLFMAPPLHIELDPLLQEIERLRDAVAANDEEAAFTVLQSIIPAFSPDRVPTAQV